MSSTQAGGRIRVSQAIESAGKEQYQANGGTRRDDRIDHRQVERSGGIQ
jgi:hypothetical protein